MSARRRTRKAAAENMRPLRQRLMDVNKSPGPEMPRIQKLANFGSVGVLSPCCTTQCGPIHHWLQATGTRSSRLAYTKWPASTPVVANRPSMH
ncbi:putative ti plasmid T-DNA region (plasmid) [Brucella anthropi]|nr:putative ti plasmid T-DNA region [Brucella anthropi]